MWATVIATIMPKACSTAQNRATESFIAPPKSWNAAYVIGLSTP